MKVFVVNVDNGMEYSDAEHHVEDVFKTFRGATECLLKLGFIPYPIKDQDGSYILTFERYERDRDKAIEGFIIIFELKE